MVGVKIGRMENRGRKLGWKIVFSTVWQKKENVEEGKSGRKFSLPGPHFILPNREEKADEKNALTALLHKCPLFPNGHSNSAKKKKTIFQPPTQHNPTITTATQK